MKIDLTSDEAKFLCEVLAERIVETLVLSLPDGNMKVTTDPDKIALVKEWSLLQDKLRSLYDKR